MMVIPIVVMLALTMVVAGWQYEEEVEIDVDEGYDEIVIPEEEIKIPEGENVTGTYPQNKSVATTYVNNESYLEFEVELEVITSSPRRHSIRFELQVRGEFDEDLEIEDFQFLAVQAGGFGENAYSYISGNYINTSGLSGWELSKQREQPESYGFDVDSNEFTAKMGYTWLIDRENWGEPHTLEFAAIVGGLSENVSVGIDVHFDGSDEA